LTSIRVQIFFVPVVGTTVLHTQPLHYVLGTCGVKEQDMAVFFCQQVTVHNTLQVPMHTEK